MPMIQETEEQNQTFNVFNAAKFHDMSQDQEKLLVSQNQDETIDPDVERQWKNESQLLLIPALPSIEPGPLD